MENTQRQDVQPVESTRSLWQDTSGRRKWVSMSYCHFALRPPEENSDRKATQREERGNVHTVRVRFETITLLQIKCSEVFGKAQASPASFRLVEFQNRTQIAMLPCIRNSNPTLDPRACIDILGKRLRRKRERDSIPASNFDELIFWCSCKTSKGSPSMPSLGSPASSRTP